MILFGGGLAAFRGVEAKQNLKQAGIEFQSNLRLIQEKTLSSKKPAECSVDPSDKLLGYKVSYVNANTYAMQPICKNGGGIVTNIILPDGISFTADFGEISFFVLQAEVNDKTIILENSDGLQYEVMIENKGVIKGVML